MASRWPAAFIQASEDIAKTGKFDDVKVESRLLKQKIKVSFTSQYTHFIEREEVPLPTTLPKLKTWDSFYKLAECLLGSYLE